MSEKTAPPRLVVDGVDMTAEMRAVADPSAFGLTAAEAIARLRHVAGLTTSAAPAAGIGAPERIYIGAQCDEPECAGRCAFNGDVSSDEVIWCTSRTSDYDVEYIRADLVRPHAAEAEALTFDAFRAANVARCVKWHPAGIASWSPSDWLTAITGELGELASLLKMRNRERDGLPGNKFSPTDKMIADELADVLTYLDLLAAAIGVDLGAATVTKFNEVSERVGFPDRIRVVTAEPTASGARSHG